MSIESNTIIPKSQFLKTNETFWPYKSMRERKIHNTFLSILPKLMKYVVVGNSLVRKVFDKEGRSVCNYHIYNWEQLYSDLTDAEKRALGGTKAGVLARLEAIFREKKQIDVNGEEYQWTTEAIEKFDTIRKEHTHHRAFKSSGEILDIDWQGVQKEFGTEGVGYDAWLALFTQWRERQSQANLKALCKRKHSGEKKPAQQTKKKEGYLKFVPSSVIRSTHPSATVLPPAVPSLMLPGRVANGMGSHLATQQEVVVCQKELPITRDELAPQTAVADSIAPDYVAVDTSGLDLLARVAEELTMGSHEALKRKAEGEQEGSKPKRAH